MAPVQMLARVLVAASWSTALAQLRGLSANKTELNATDQTLLRSAWGSCQQYGCPSTYIQSQACQCNSRCKDYNNCCSDITSCNAGAPAAGSPAGGAPSPTQISGHPDPSKQYPSYPGFTLALVEEFDSPLDLDSDPIWTWSDGGLFEGDVRFVKQQIRFEDGKMKITATQNPGYSTQACSHAEVGTVEHKPLVSGEFRSRRNIFRYGRYEVRMKAPDVQPGNPDVDGNFVATMFVFRDAKFRHWREIDIEVTGDSPNSVTTNVLRADNTEFWRPQIASVRTTSVSGNARAEFHTYGFEWLPDRITWYIDGVPVRSHYGGKPPIPDKSAKVMMNLWIFGPKANFGGRQIYNNRYPMTSEYDWFRFYKWDGETTYPCQRFSTSCLSSDDRYLDGNNPCDGQPMLGTWKGQAACSASCR
ncbi:licB [Symbiodinium sp. CCMP2592]|nr:licB [Symbiodinium sp. CCMP2592]